MNSPLKLAAGLIVLLLTGALQAQEQAKVESLTGKPHFIRAFKKNLLNKGDGLLQKDIIVTPDDSSALVKLPTGDLIEVGQKSSVKMSKFLKEPVEKGLSTEVELLNGTGSFTARKLTQDESFSVKSPVAVIAVRGTKFLVRHKFSRRYGMVSTVAVISGKVQVASVRFKESAGYPAVSVGQMQKSEISEEAPPTPARTMNLVELRTMQAEAGISTEAKDEKAAETEPKQEASGQEAVKEAMKESREDAQQAAQEKTVERVQEQVSESVQERIQESIQENIKIQAVEAELRRPHAPPSSPE